MSDIPPVCFIEDLTKHLRISRRSLERLRRCRAFPIPEMPTLDSRPRWSGAKVREFIASEDARLRLRRVR